MMGLANEKNTLYTSSDPHRGIFSGIHSGVLPRIYSDILILSGIVSGILFGIWSRRGPHLEAMWWCIRRPEVQLC